MRRYKPHELRLFFEQELVKQIVKHRGGELSDKAMQDVLLQCAERVADSVDALITSWGECLDPKETDNEPRPPFGQEVVKQIVKYREENGLAPKAMQDVLLQCAERLKLSEGAPRRKTTDTPREPERDEAGRFVTGSPAAYAAGSRGGNLTSGKYRAGEERTREAARKAAAARWTKDKASDDTPP
jgi:hypothetical protein